MPEESNNNNNNLWLMPSSKGTLYRRSSLSPGRGREARMATRGCAAMAVAAAGLACCFDFGEALAVGTDHACVLLDDGSVKW